MGQDLGIQSVRLGQLASGAGKLAHLAWVDRHRCQAGGAQGGEQRHLQTARGLEDHQCWSQAAQALHQFGHAARGMRGLPALTTGSDGNLQSLLGYVDADEAGRYLCHAAAHSRLLGSDPRVLARPC